MSLPLVRGRLSAEARRDLFDIQDYMLDKAPEHWASLRKRLEEGVLKVTRRPGLGRSRTDLVPDKYRFYLVPPYFLIFEMHRGDVVITRILHAARDITAVLDEE